MNIEADSFYLHPTVLCRFLHSQGDEEHLHEEHEHVHEAGEY